jgi:hypothetical protein
MIKDYLTSEIEEKPKIITHQLHKIQPNGFCEICGKFNPLNGDFCGPWIAPKE